MASFPHKLRLPDSKLQAPNTLPQAAALRIEIFRKLAEKKHLLRAIEIAILCSYFLGAGGKMLKCRGR